MSVLSSLTNRIFLASALLAVLSIGAAFVSVNVAVTRQAEGELVRGLEEASGALEEYREALFDHFSREARLVADLPRLKAAVSSMDAPTVQPVAGEYQEQLGADLLIVTDARGQTLAQVGAASGVDAAALPGTAVAARGTESRSFVSLQGGILHVASVPIWIDPQQPEILGTLSVGLVLDDRAALQFRALTNSEIAFGSDGRIFASTLPVSAWGNLTTLLSASGTTHAFPIGNEEYIAVTRPLTMPRGDDAPAIGRAGGSVPIAIILRSRTERLRFLYTVHRALGITAVAAVLVATLLSYATARSVTRPLRAVTAAMRDMATTGDLTRRLPSAGRSPWEDEDARLLGETFGTMTASIARFQRDASQRERLSSLGRLSTIVAHEIRNPLMIIKAALRDLRRGDLAADAVAHAVTDIGEEIARLERLVTEVLDFARPIRFEYAPVDINSLCRDAAQAIAPGAHGVIALRLSPELAPLVTDRERLRMVLVNVLDNARQAIASAPDQAAGRAGIAIVTSSGAHSGVTIAIQDEGPGISSDDMAHVFEPYFTTRRTGTGLGLAICRNIIEGLGGTITVAPGTPRGTSVQIYLPQGPAPAS
jgi:signal transduction histidine kinase